MQSSTTIDIMPKYIKFVYVLAIAITIAVIVGSPKNCVQVFSHFEKLQVDGKVYSIAKYTCKPEKK